MYSAHTEPVTQPDDHEGHAHSWPRDNRDLGGV
jgi:hypothetical protein